MAIDLTILVLIKMVEMMILMLIEKYDNDSNVDNDNAADTDEDDIDL